MPHFRDCLFTGRYPFADIDFEDETFPGEVRLSAFNPLIPLNDMDSSLPAAFFEVAFDNTNSVMTTYSAAFTLKNPFAAGANASEYSAANGMHSITCRPTAIQTDDVAYGDMTIATDSADASYQRYWYRGSWFDNLSVYWRDLNTKGPFADRSYDGAAATDGIAYGKEDHCTLAGRIDLAPGTTGSIRFVLAWNFPNASNYWNPENRDESGCDGDESREGRQCCPPSTWKNSMRPVSPGRPIAPRLHWRTGGGF